MVTSGNGIKLECSQLMVMKKILELTFAEAYKLGREDGQNGMYIKPEKVFEQFLIDTNHKVDLRELLDLLETQAKITGGGSSLH